MTRIKNEVLKLSEYQVPQDFTRIKLNQNESPVDLPESMKEEIYLQLTATPWNRYPDFNTDTLLKSLSEYAGLSKKRILAGNSSNELIQTIIYSLCRSGDTIVTVNPGFSVYKRVADVMGIHTIEIPLGEDFKFKSEAILKGALNARIIILASPNNPTGTILDMDGIKYLANNFEGTLVMDEAYFEFSKQTAQGYLNTFDNLLIVRTFSKALSLAGARLGYMMGSEEIIREMQKAKLPYSLGIFQQIAGEVLLRHTTFIEKIVSDIITERERVFSMLKNHPALYPVQSSSNFILFQTGGFSAKKLFQALYNAGILVRYFDSPILKNWLRVAIGLSEENDRFIKTITNIVGNQS